MCQCVLSILISPGNFPRLSGQSACSVRKLGSLIGGTFFALAQNFHQLPSLPAKLFCDWMNTVEGQAKQNCVRLISFFETTFALKLWNSLCR
jgi:hypothetical protein